MSTSYKENIIFETKNKEIKVYKDNVKPINIVEDIYHIQNNKENVYIFNSGDTAEFLYERSCVNDLSFNYFQLYNKSSYKCLKKIKDMLYNICKETNINTEKNMFFITSEYETNILHNFVYDFGGYGETSFCGYWFLGEEDGVKISLNEKEHNVSNGDIFLFQSNAKIKFYGISKAISFNISTFSKIKGQYPQKWMPIILS